jgi:hypothetical protein
VRLEKSAVWVLAQPICSIAPAAFALCSSSMMGERYDEESHCAKKPDYEPASHDHTTISAGAVRSLISRIHARMHVEPGYHACAETLYRIHGRAMPVLISEAVGEVLLSVQLSGRRAFVVDHGRSSNRYYWLGEVWVEVGFVLQRGAVRLKPMFSPCHNAYALSGLLNEYNYQ